MTNPLNFGVFLTPFHAVGQSPTVAFEYDMDRTVALDRLGYDEVWFGEHHSGGYELITCPEVFIAAAAERTKHIRLGTGVVSLPYHHPLMVADRWVLLDHLTRGRVMFGTGPGSLPSDAYMMGIDPVDQRPMAQESLEAILALLRAAPGERISRQTDWFTLRDAALHIRPYTWPYPEISTAAMISPTGPRLAGALGTSLLSLSMSMPGGYAALENTWEVVVDQAAKAGRAEPDRKDWRVLAVIHLADTRDQAIEDCTYGLQDFADYFASAGFIPLANSVEHTRSKREFVEDYADKGNCCIGTPSDAVTYIQSLLDTAGGFGTLLLLGHDWAPPAATYHSYELFAREVMPHFKGQLSAPQASHDWAKGKRDQLLGRAIDAIGKATTEHTNELKTATDNRQQLMRASVLREGRRELRDDMPDSDDR
ncbi:limonene 1,2-monooxygenase [Mycobacterium sp. URHB0021]